MFGRRHKSPAGACAHVAHAPPLASVCRPKGYNAMGVQPRLLVPTCEVLSRIMLWVFRGTYILRHFVQWHRSGRLPSSGKGAWRGLVTLVYHERTAAFCQAFQKFYVERQPGRKLQWDMSKGRAEARPCAVASAGYP